MMQKLNLKLTVVMVLLMILTTQMTFAQRVVRLDSAINITASRVETKVLKSGKSISVITQDDLKNAPVNTLDELLRFIPGVNLNSRSAFGAQTDIGMRGSTFTQVLVLLDGTRVNDPLTGHYNQNIPVSLADIAQVEVIKGPMAASYGADAVGGVIHIKTKTYLATGKEEDQINLVGEAGVGEFGLFNSDIGFYQKKGKIQYSVGVKRVLTDGQELENPNNNFDTAVNLFGAPKTYNNFLDLQTYNASLAYVINDEWKVFSRFGYDKRAFSAKYFYSNSIFDESVENTDSWWGQMVVQKNGEKWDSQLNIGYKKGSDKFDFNPLFAPIKVNSHLTQMLNINFNNTLHINNNIDLTLGLQGGHREIESSANGDHNNQSMAFYTSLFFQLSDKWNATLTNRFDYDDNYGFENLPSFNLAFNPTDHLAIRGSIGRSIRAGDYVERFINYLNTPKVPGRSIGNPFLNAERSISYEVGAEYLTQSNLQISVSGFIRESTDLIDYVTTSADQIDQRIPGISLEKNDNNQFATFPLAQNVSESSTRGVELALSKSIQIGSDHSLNLNLATTFLDTVQPKESFSRYIADHPNWNHVFIADYKYKGFALNFTLSHIIREQQAAEGIGAEVKNQYTLAHLKLSQNLYEDKVGVFVKIHNVLDTDYQEVLGAQMPGRWTMVGINFNLK